MTENGRRVILTRRSSIRVYSEDFLDDVEPPATVGILVENPRKKPAGQNLYEYIQSQNNAPETQQNNLERHIHAVTIHSPTVVNGSTMVKAETTHNGFATDLYFLEKDETTFLAIRVVKFKPEEAKKYDADISAIMASFKFLKGELDAQGSL